MIFSQFQFNREYARLWKEPMIVTASRMAIQRTQTNSPRVLIVICCLIGEFAAAVPAIRDYIERNSAHTIDLMVTPSCADLARHIQGVGNVFEAKSIYMRDNEKVVSAVFPEFPEYKKVLILRASSHVLRSLRKVKAQQVVSYASTLIWFAFHLFWCDLTRRQPRQWREMNFHILGGQVRPMPFDELFSFSAEEQERIAAFPVLKSSKTLLLVHLYTAWPMKRWMNDRWITLLQRIKEAGIYEVVFIGGGEDAKLSARIIATLGEGMHTLAGKLNLGETLLFMRHASVFIGVDSGPAALAHLADLRSIVLFGPGPHFYLPWNTQDIIIDKSRGRGMVQMFFYRKKGFTSKITVSEVWKAFTHLR